MKTLTSIHPQVSSVMTGYLEFTPEQADQAIQKLETLSSEDLNKVAKTFVTNSIKLIRDAQYKSKNTEDYASSSEEEPSSSEEDAGE